MARPVFRSPSRTFTAWCGAFVAGIALHAFSERPWLASSLWLTAAVLAAAFCYLGWHRPAPRFIFGVVLVLIVGLWRYDAVLAPPPAAESLPQRTASFTGTVAAEPSTGINRTDLILTDIRLEDSGSIRRVGGSFHLSSPVSSSLRYGDRLAWRCRPQAPGDLAVAQAERLVYRGIVARCSVREPPEIIGSGEGGRWLAPLFVFKDRLRRTVGRLLPEPESSFLLGLLVGDRDGLPATIRDSFRRTGTSHILAVSGYNVARVVGVVMILLACAAIRRRAAAGLAAVAVIGFAALVGGEASVVRAAVMGSISLLAIIVRRRFDPAIALLAVAAGMLAFNPPVLRHDIGFQLSFAAVWGLHALGPPLAERLKFIPEFFTLRQTFAETVAATLATLPIIGYSFGALPLLSPLVNVIVLPIVPWAMAAGAVGVALGSVWMPLAVPFVFAAFILLRVVISVIGWCDANLPGPLDVRIDPAAAVIMTLAIVALWFAWTRRRPEPVEDGGGPSLPPETDPLPQEYDVEIIDCRSETVSRETRRD